jgi:uroporphyrinogen decarboxylase
MSRMTSLERVNTVLAGGIPDRVPVHLNNFMMNARASGRPFTEHFHSGEAMAEGHLQAWREYGHDLLILENGTVALAEACGCEAEYLAESAPVLIKPVLNSLDELDRLQLPDPHKAASLLVNLRATHIVAKEVGDRVCVMGRADQGPYSLASMLMGVEDFLLALTDPDNKDKLNYLLEFSLEACYRYACAQRDEGAHITSIGESLAGPDVSSPRMYKTFEWPFACQLAARLKETHLPLAYHICGNATRIAIEMATTGAAILELDYKCDLPAIKKATQGKAVILGAIDPSGVLALGTPELVVEKVREELSILGPGGGFILGPGCALPSTTPPENIHALIEAAEKYGRYRADGTLVSED